MDSLKFNHLTVSYLFQQYTILPSKMPAFWNTVPMVIGYFFANRQPDARARKLAAAVRSLE